MADVTEQTPLAATEPRPKSIKRLVVTSAAISLALGFAAVTAVDHGLMSFSSLPYVHGGYLKRRLDRKVELSAT